MNSAGKVVFTLISYIWFKRPLESPKPLYLASYVPLFAVIAVVAKQGDVLASAEDRLQCRTSECWVSTSDGEDSVLSGEVRTESRQLSLERFQQGLTALS